MPLPSPTSVDRPHLLARMVQSGWLPSNSRRNHARERTSVQLAFHIDPAALVDTRRCPRCLLLVRTVEAARGHDVPARLRRLTNPPASRGGRCTINLVAVLVSVSSIILSPSQGLFNASWWFFPLPVLLFVSADQPKRLDILLQVCLSIRHPMGSLQLWLKGLSVITKSVAAALSSSELTCHRSS